MKTKEQIIEIIETARNLGVTSVEIDGVKYDIASKPTVKVEAVSQDVSYKDLMAEPSPFDQLSDEEILFWSSGYGVELENKKNEEKSKREDELQKVEGNDLFS